MTYNLHPLFVHFPIALLLLYSVVKIIPFRKWFPDTNWKITELILLIPGFLGAVMASTTGEVAEHLVKANHDLVETHSLFAGISTWVYGLILLGELFYFINRKDLFDNRGSLLSKISANIERILCNRKICVTLATVGIISIAITGILGGVIVYGTTADPVAPFVLNILGITL